MTLRSPMLEFSTVTFTTDQYRDGWVKLDVRRLDELHAVASSTAEVASTYVDSHDDTADVAAAAGYALGAADVLAWLAGGPADERLVALLDPDGGQ